MIDTTVTTRIETELSAKIEELEQRKQNLKDTIEQDKRKLEKAEYQMKIASIEMDDSAYSTAKADYDKQSEALSMHESYLIEAEGNLYTDEQYKTVSEELDKEYNDNLSKVRADIVKHAKAIIDLSKEADEYTDRMNSLLLNVKNAGAKRKVSAYGSGVPRYSINSIQRFANNIAMDYFYRDETN